MMRRLYLFAAVLAGLLLLAGCDKPYQFSRPIRLQSDVVRLSSAAGSTPVVVFANKQWSCRFVEDVDWMRLEVASGKGVGEAHVSYDANPGAERTAVLLFEAEGQTARLEMIQSGN